ncbi:MAG TPA: GNAT family N-acetyltransferase [Pontiella sp.]
MVKIRTATANDIPEMAGLLEQLFSIEVDFYPDLNRQIRGLGLLLQSDSSEIFIAEHQGHVIGMCTIQIHISTAIGSTVAKIEDVIVDINYRGKGIGSSLLQSAEEWSSKRNLPRLQLQADRENLPALKFYEALQWKQTNLIGYIKHINK